MSSSNEIAGLPGVERVVLLPDVHLKEKYVRAEYKATVPSSAVIVSEAGRLYPQFRSRGLGCGMMLVGTGIRLNGASSDPRRILRALPRYWSNTVEIPPGTASRVRRSFAMSADDMLQMATRGAPWVAAQFGLPARALRGFFREGSFFSEEEAARFSWDDFAPEWLAGERRDGRRLGLDLGGNHFLEAQVVHDVPAGASDLLPQSGELVFLYHGACNGLASVLRSELVGALAERRHYAALAGGTPDYDLVGRAVRVLLNWSAASRCLVMARLRSLVAHCYPGAGLDALRCVSEAPHNSILLENGGNLPRIVYRHNAVPMEPGRPTIVSGRNDHMSYLFLPGPTPERSVRTLDHGVGAILGRRPAREYAMTRLICRRVERHELRGRPLWHRRRDCGLIDPAAVEELFREPYVEAGVTQSACCRLRPLATLKRKAIPLRRLLRFPGVER